LWEFAVEDELVEVEDVDELAVFVEVEELDDPDDPDVADVLDDTLGGSKVLWPTPNPIAAASVPLPLTVKVSL
jgi:hypothetical protein